MEEAPLTVLCNGRVHDGSAAPLRAADVWLRDDRIVAVRAAGDPLPASPAACAAARRVDCAGRVVAPGFIDVHTHDDAIVLEQPDMLPKLSQGITTVIGGNCGISLVPLVTDEPAAPLSLLGRRQFRFPDVASYRAAVDAVRPAVNVALLVGHTALRMRTMAALDRPADDGELERMAALLDQAMRDGAVGLSSGVFYAPAYAADVRELAALVRVVAPYGGVYATHIRDELKGILEAIDEAALTAREGGAFLVLSHHKCAGPMNWGRTGQTLGRIEALARRQPIGLDVYPYTAGSTVLREDLVDGVIDILITGSVPHPGMAGRHLADIAAEWGVSQVEACRRLQPGGACYFQMRQDDVDRIVSHPLAMIGSDGLPHDERPHPRLWGAFPRVLDQYWREKGLLPLEQALHKMTGLSAGRFHLEGRGRLRPGGYADIVVLDPARVRDRATYAEPARFSEGIEQVWVNGRLSYTARDQACIRRAGRFVPRAADASSPAVPPAAS
ncbi:N-acyl-D-amino-acid deacylase family protein [Castellaniella defragrans]|uniref:N-acyl-D-amino-acid deacylase n=1 Tax=Castellaniella defragrans TaxID=75697 RepID=A0A7W9TNQ2_CASDE|nr:D-aminoacylase [Castellaniella defragrans]KAB0604951.1 D-aminoacylase [Castellaniella defragrans]MBB6084113.1 N-acyl-D-amino-acid deacylase [Castellaniella defragrans]